MSFHPSPFRCSWRTYRLDTAKIRSVPLKQLDHEVNSARRHAAIFAGAREEYGLTIGEVATGWAIPQIEISELEMGLRRFQAPADLHVALLQLWLWANEKNKGISSSS